MSGKALKKQTSMKRTSSESSGSEKKRRKPTTSNPSNSAEGAARPMEGREGATPTLTSADAGAGPSKQPAFVIPRRKEPFEPGFANSSEGIINFF